MDHGIQRMEIFPDHFGASIESTPTRDYLPTRSPPILQPRSDSSLRSRGSSWAGKKLMRAASMLNLFSLPGLPWGSSSNGDDKVALTVAELEALRSEIADAEEREAHLKAQLEHLDVLLRSARLAGYLYMRTRWTALPGEPPIDDTDVDDWLPRFVVLHGTCIFFYLQSTDLSPQDSTLLSDVVEVGPLPSFLQEDQQIRYSFYILTCHGLRFECSSLSNIQVDSWLAALKTDCKFSQIYRSASKTVKALFSASKSSPLFVEGRAVAVATVTSFRGKVPAFASVCERTDSRNAFRGWVSGALVLPAAVYMLQEQEAHGAEMERTFIAIKPDGVQRGRIAEIISRFERKGYKLVAIKLVVPSKEFAEKHYHDLKERPFFSGLCDFLSSGPVLAMVWEGEGVIKYGRKLIGATDPQKSEPGTIRGDLAVVMGGNVIHGSDGPETAKDEIGLWFQPSELVNYTSNAEKWVYGVN
ncbi:nucleoside diphosphate kinase III, chloroplastic/mitochondrial-like isoform X3 [Tasmannia lanceolata]|uniref:nucleoside diphosphate kinase III, chloroplastic/mitochondrial-like isoform X3 n=1 Tax=Tasmannia lanceolata TaxID=3420 RepID=UPI004062F5E3